MSVGTVKWFNPSKGYGFVEPSDGSKDVFIHISALERAGIGSLSEGQKIEFVPLDTRLELPESEFSYVLQDWAQSLDVDHAFARQRVLGAFETIKRG